MDPQQNFEKQTSVMKTHPEFFWRSIQECVEGTGTPHQQLHGTPWMLTGLHTTLSMVLHENRYYTSIHHVSRTDQNCAVLKRAENIMRHVEMWSVVSQKETVRASRKMCSGLRDSDKIVQVKFISWVKHHKQCAMILALLLFLFRFRFPFFFFVFFFSVFCGRRKGREEETNLGVPLFLLTLGRKEAHQG